MASAAAKGNVAKSLAVSNAVSILLFGMRVAATDNNGYWFLFWNLLLAWVPVLFAWLLIRRLKTHSWKEPLPILLTILWLGFLPNSFYLMSDLIHLQSTGQINILFDTVLFLSCIWNGVVAGMLSLYWVQTAVVKRKGAQAAAWLAATTLLLASFAIYLGRSLRWNSWDVLFNPAGILFDVSERVINPLSHPQVFVTTFTFFLLLGSMYYAIWNFVQSLKRHA
jgi:uncharacterized membrane protein